MFLGGQAKGHLHQAAYFTYHEERVHHVVSAPSKKNICQLVFFFAYLLCGTVLITAPTLPQQRPNCAAPRRTTQHSTAHHHADYASPRRTTPNIPHCAALRRLRCIAQHHTDYAASRSTTARPRRQCRTVTAADRDAP